MNYGLIKFQEGQQFQVPREHRKDKTGIVKENGFEET